MGVWIETYKLLPIRADLPVTPHVGVWIETREPNTEEEDADVTPHVGVWIETLEKDYATKADEGHTPCGCVD